MQQVFGSFNAIFSKNNKTNAKIDRQFGEGSYDVYVKAVDELFAKTQSTKNIIPFETGEMKNFQSVKQRLNEAIKLQKAMQDGKNIISYDIETLGSMSSRGFSVTEYFALLKNYATGKTSPLIDIKPGVSRNVGSKLLKDVRDAFDGENVEGARVTAMRTQFINAENGNVTDLEVNRESIRMGIEKLQKKDVRYGDDTLTDVLKIEAEKIKDIKENTITIGYNIKQFDNEVRKRMLMDHGLDINMLSTDTEIDIFELMMTAFDTEIHGMYERNGMGDVKGKFRVENLAKLFGVDAGTSHIAEDDTNTVFKILEAEFDFDGTGTKENVLSRIIKNITNKIENANKVTNNDNVLFKSINSNQTVENFSFNKSAHPHGSISSGDLNKHLDFMVDTYSGKPMHYRDRSSSRGLFYQAGEMRVIPKEALSQETLNALGEGAEEAYVLPLSVYDDNGFGHTSYIVRKTKQEVEDALSSNFIAYNVFDNTNDVKGRRGISKEMAKVQQEVYNKDLARRNFDAMFQMSSQKDFNYAKRMYEAYRELNRNHKMIAGVDADPLTQTQVMELVKTGYLQIGEKTLSLEEHVKKLKRPVKDIVSGEYVDGSIVTEWARDFGYMYGLLQDTEKTIYPVISQIDRTVTFENRTVKKIMSLNAENKTSVSSSESYAVLNRIKKEALVNTYSEMIGAVSELTNIDSKELFDTVIDADNINYFNYADISIDGSTKAINISTLDNAIESLSKVVNKDSYLTKNNAAKKNLATARLVEITRDLSERGIVSTELLGEVSLSADPFSATKAVANELFNYASNIKGDMPDEKIVRYMIDALTNEESKVDEKFVESFSKLRSGIPTNRALNELIIGSFHFDDFITTHAPGLGNIMEVDNFVDDLVSKNINKLKSSFNFTLDKRIAEAYMRARSLEEKIKFLPENFVGYLRGEMNYEDREIKEVADMLYHYNNPMQSVKDFMDITKEDAYLRGNVGNGYIPRGYGVTFVIGEKNGDKTHGFLIHKPEDAEVAINAYLRGEMSSKAAYQPIPTVTKRFNRRFIKQGNSYKMVVESLRATTGDSLHAPTSIVLRESNTIIDVLRSSSDIKNKVDIAIQDGNYEEASRLMNNRYNKIIGNEIGTTAFKRINNKKQFAPSQNDLVRYKKNSGLMALLPSVYYENSIVNDEMNRLFGEDAVKNEFDKIEKNKWNLDTLKLRSDIDEWYHKNLFNGMNLASKMKDINVTTLDGKTKNLLDTKSIEFLEKAEKEAMEGSAMTKEHLAGKYNGLVVLDSHVQMDANSQYDNPVRPLHEQRTGKKPIVYEEMINNTKEKRVNDVIKRLEGNKIYLGAMTRIRKTDIEYIGAAETEGMPLYEGISAKVLQMPSAGYYEIVNNVDPITFKKRFEDVKGKKVSMDDVMYVLSAYQNNGATNEQHSIVRPSVAEYIGPKPDTISVKLQGVQASSFNLGQKVDGKTVIGIFRKDNKLKNITYSKVPGTIVDIDEAANMLQIEPLERTFDEIKFNLGAEKTVATPVRGNNQMQFEISEFAFDEFFGKDVALVGHFAYGKHKSAGSLMQSKFDSVITMLNIYGNKEDFELFKNIVNQSEIKWNLDYRLDKRTGVIRAVRDVSPTDGNAYKMFDSILTTFFSSSNNKILIGATMKELEDNKAGNKLRATMGLADLNESMQAADDELGRGIKDTVRKRQNIGTYVVDGFRKVDENNKLQRVVQPIIDMNLEQIQNSPQFRDAFIDIGNLYNASSLIAGKSVNTKILEKNFEDIDVSSKSLTVDMLTNNVYGLNADEYSVLKLNLKNYRIINPVSKNKEDFLYIPILHTNILDDNQIYVSKSQKTTAHLLRLLSIRENFESLEGTSFDNYEKLERAITDAYMDLFNSFSYEYSNKTGILNDVLMSGRVEMSGMSLSVGIIPADFKDAKKTQMYSKLGDQMITIQAGQPRYDSVVFASEDYLKSMGVNFKDIGNQLIRNDFLGDEEFKKLLLGNQYIDTNGELIKENLPKDIKNFIGRFYAENIGIDSIVTREPNFHPGSTLAAKTKLLPTLKGYTVMLSPWVAKPHNADIDGDNEFVQLVGLKKSGDKVLLRGNDDKISIAINELLEHQAKLNEQYVKENGNLVELEYDEDGKFTGKYEYTNSKDKKTFTISEEEMMEIIKEDFGMDNMNFFSEDTDKIKGSKDRFTQLGIKARQNKGNIGNISNENFKVREMAFSLLEENAYNDYDYVRIIDFTTLTEQKIIDTKHANVESLTVADLYSQGMRLMGKGKTDENFNKGFEYIVEAVSKSGMHENIDTAENIINNTYIKNEGNKQLRAIYELFNNDKAIKIYSAKTFNQSIEIGTNKESSKKYTEELLKEIEFGLSDEEAINKTVKYNNELVRKASKGNSVSINGMVLSKGDILENNATKEIFEIMEVDNFKSHAILKNLINEENITIFGTDERTLEQSFAYTYKALLGEEKKNAINTIEKMHKEMAFDSLFDDSHDVMTALHASFIEENIAKMKKKDARKFRAEYISNNNLSADDILDMFHKNELSSGKIFGAIQDMSDSDKNLLKLGYDLLSEQYKKHEVTKNQMDSILKDINDNIIKRADNAIKKRNAIKQKVEEEILNLAQKNANRVSYSDMREQIKSLKRYDITSMRKEYNEALHKAGEEFSSNVKYNKLIEEFIEHSTNLANENIDKAIKHNIEIGNKKTELFAKIYDFEDIRERYLKWNNRTQTAARNMKKGRYISAKEFKALSNARVGFGEYAEYKLSDLSLETLKKLSEETIETTDENIHRLMKESQNNINAYANYLVNGRKSITDGTKNSKPNIKKLTKPLDNDFAVEKLNERIMKLAEEKRSSVKESLVETSEKVINSKGLKDSISKNKILIGAGIAAASVMALNLLVGDDEIKPEKVATNTQPPPEENTNEKPKVYSAPPSKQVSNKTFMEGITMDIKARIKESIDKRSVANSISSAFQETVGNRVDISVREEKQRDEVNDSWLKEKISKLLH